MDNIMIYIWLFIFFATLIIEIVVPGLVSIWFSIGSLPPLFLAFFVKNDLIWLQILLFVLTSALTLFLLRPLALKRRPNELKSNVDSLLGEVGIVEDNIEPLNNGTVKVHGLIWTAEVGLEDEPISKGEKVLIKEVNGNKLKVELYKEEK